MGVLGQARLEELAAQVGGVIQRCATAAGRGAGKRQAQRGGAALGGRRAMGVRLQEGRQASPQAGRHALQVERSTRQAKRGRARAQSLDRKVGG